MGYAIVITDSNGTRLWADVDGNVKLFAVEGEARAWANKLATLPGVNVQGVNWLD